MWCDLLLDQKNALTKKHLCPIAGQALLSSVDGGASYWDAESVRSAFEQLGGLSATKV
jgi:hypothetical protein